jgi:Xaa-Pro aminopeptidase
MSLAMQITRRARLAGLMGEGIAVLPTSPELARNADTQFPYRFDSSFFYLSGFGEPEAVLVLFAGDLRRSLLFCRNKDVEREIWDGFRYGPDAAREQFGFDEAYPIDELDKMMPSLLENQPKLYATLGADPAWDSRLIGWLNEVRSRARTGVQAPKEILDLRSLVHEMRLFKDESELATMRRAGQISRDAHVRAMRFTRPGQFEYQVEAELIHEFYRNGSRFPAYTSIVAGGANACVLHYVENNAELRDGDLLLIDAGCELHGYAADITRTFPVNGKFSAAQKDVYEIVLAAQLRGDKRRQTRQHLEHAARRGAESAGARHAGPEAAARQRRRRDRKRKLQAVLHAPHRPLAGHGRARRWRLQAQRPMARAAAGHGADGGAGAVFCARPRMCRTGAGQYRHPY